MNLSLTPRCPLYDDMQRGTGYKIHTQLGKGTYGQVFSGSHVATGRPVALKRIRYNVSNEYLFLFFREIAILKSISHFAILEIQDVVCNSIDSVLVVTDLFDFDLRTFVKRTFPDRKVPLGELRPLIFQLLAGVAYLHSRKILHRDIKPQNILIKTDSRTIRIADFGLSKNNISRILSRHESIAMTHEIVTLWYRAPEVILGAPNYTHGIDLWSIGSTLSELIVGTNLFNGRSEVETLMKIFELVGTPGLESCPDCESWANFSHRFPSWDPRYALKRISKKLHDSPVSVIELVHGLMLIGSRDRLSASTAMKNEWFEGLNELMFVN